MSTSPSPHFTAFQLHDFQTPSSSGPALPGDASTIKSIEAAIKKHAALYALLHSPFLSKKSSILILELSLGWLSLLPMCEVLGWLSTQGRHGPTAEECQEFLGMIAIIVIIFGSSALNDVVSAIPLPGSPLLEDWEPAKLHASPKALGIMYNITSITPGTVAIVSMLVYFILSGDTEMVSGHGKPSRMNYLEILLNFYKFIHMVLKQEETAMTCPMHETIHWFQYLLFGSSVGEEPNVLMEAGSISVGLNALLAEMDLNDSEVGPPAESPVRFSI
ncbi:uncharacterized protein EI90DRAFT_3020009 [Cantharellus anzutake]|uniref:uncharacterized protein n=1 Tax=Cantharellus anzutake TaxID=1750568 RepID=UPI001906A19C|nr:uncharacterized protein EI90DRAFT_3020009 [Cantharellus anzutake]KAF8322854.1 hypothetical protein EI90DRAFT_3020009 [Cantharellus anzutake]